MIRTVRIILAVGYIALTSVLVRAPSVAAQRSSTDLPPVNITAFRGAGALAFVWRGRLYILDGATGQLRRLTQAGAASYPSWSHDGQWLAWQEGNGHLWLANRAGASIHPAGGISGAVGDFRWSPTQDVLAAIPNPLSCRVGGIWLVHPGRPARRLARRELAGSFLWAPTGAFLQFAGGPIGTPRDAQPQYLYTVDVPAGTVRQGNKVPSSHGNGIRLVGWWPDGKRLLYWLDPQYSSSMAANGMRLYSLDPASGRTRLLTTTLGYRDWIAPAPPGRRILIVAGGYRSAWSGKYVSICVERTNRCNPLVAGPLIVTEDPAWSPAGNAFAFIQADASLNSGAGFQSVAGQRWIQSRTLWAGHADGSNLHQVRPAGTGVFAPTWSHDGHQLLFVRDNALWLDSPFDATAPIKIARLFAGSALPDYPRPYSDIEYYGHVDWHRLFAWYSG